MWTLRAAAHFFSNSWIIWFEGQKGWIEWLFIYEDDDDEVMWWSECYRVIWGPVYIWGFELIRTWVTFEDASFIMQIRVIYEWPRIIHNQLSVMPTSRQDSPSNNKPKVIRTKLIRVPIIIIAVKFRLLWFSVTSLVTKNCPDLRPILPGALSKTAVVDCHTKLC